MPDSANNVTVSKDTPERGYLSDPFDKTKVWEEQCSPLVEQLFAICKEHDMPFLSVALHGFERYEDGTGAEARQSRAVHLPGVHRVPHIFSIAAKLFEDPEYYQFVENLSQLYAMKQIGDMEG